MICLTVRRLCIYLTLFLLITSALESWNYDNVLQQLLKTKTDSQRTTILQRNNENLNKELLSTLLAQGDQLLSKFEYDQAMAAFESAKLLSEKMNDPAAKSAALMGIGREYSAESKDDLAMKYFQEAYQLSDSINDLTGKAEALRRIARMHLVYRRFEDQMKCLEESLKIEESINNKAGIAASLYMISLNHLEEGAEEEQGLEELKKSLALAEESGDNLTAASAINQYGVYYEHRGNFDLAMKYYERAANLARAIEHYHYLASILHNIANVFYYKGNYVEALRFHLQALKIREMSKNHRSVGISLNEIGSLYAKQGEFDLALQYLNRSYKLLTEAKDSYFSALVLSSIGIVYLQRNEPDKAIQYLTNSLREPEKLDPSDIADILFSMAETYSLKKEFLKARELNNSALAKLEKDPLIPLKSSILEANAWNEYQLGNFDESMRLADEAIAFSRKSELSEQLWSALLCKAKNFIKFERQQDAEDALQESIEVVESLRQQVAGGEERTQRYLERRIQPYPAMIELLVREKRNQDAFRYAERAKARVLLDVMQKGRVDVMGAMTAEEKAEEAKLKENLYVFNVKYQENASTLNPDSATLNTLKSKLEKARLDYDEFRNKLYATHPELKVQRGEAEVLNIEEVSAILPDNKTAFLEYVVSEDKNYLLYLTRSGIKVYEIPVSEEKLRTKISNLRNQISKRDPGFQRNAKDLYRILIAPIGSELEQLQQAIIIPDGILWELPFQALIAENGKYFLENTAVSYEPSITALSEMKKLGKKSVTNPKILAFANPSVGKEISEKVEIVFRDRQLHPLPEAEVEVKKLAALYGSERTDIYVGVDAKESVLKQEIGKHNIIHLATHGILNESSPMYSNLLFSRSGAGDPEDGLLEAWEIMNMNLNAELVILSACETARGRIGAGEGLIGINWAFFVAGCPTTVVSQWKVESNSTAELMFRFHQNLQNPQTSKSQALQQAALSILKNPDYRHPFYWASFIIVGNPNFSVTP